MKTAMQELIEFIESTNNTPHVNLTIMDKAKKLLEKEKEQIQKAFSDGQETPINHPTLPHYSREEYYSDNYNENQ
jgi:low affinity Fe/Cu permease